MSRNFECHTSSEHAKSIADYLPNDTDFESKNVKDSNIRNLLLGLAAEMVRDEGTIKQIAKEHDIRQTTDLIVEWENMVGIPDDCFDRSGTIDVRRRNVLIKLAFVLVTEQDYIDLGLLLGVEVKLLPLPDCLLFPLLFPAQFCLPDPNAKFVLIIQLPEVVTACIFPILFPVCFASGIRSLIECIFRKLSPANVRLIFEYVL